MTMRISSWIFPVLFLPAFAAANCYDPARWPQENFNHCQIAAERGDAIAQYFLGQMYRKGDGVSVDPNTAIYWYQKAAAQQNTMAQYNLGWMYDTGEGVDRDLDQAIFWYSKAAKLSDPYAPFNLGSIYFEGKDFPRDPETALFWFEVAIANGNEKAPKWRDKIKAALPAEQVERVEARFEQWKVEN